MIGGLETQEKNFFDEKLEEEVKKVYNHHSEIQFKVRAKRLTKIHSIDQCEMRDQLKRHALSDTPKLFI